MSTDVAHQRPGDQRAQVCHRRGDSLLKCRVGRLETDEVCLKVMLDEHIR